MKTPILDQIEFGMDNGIILLVIAIAIISVLVWIVNTLINILVDKKVKKQLHKEKIIQQQKEKREELVNDFFVRNIDTDIEQMYITGTPKNSSISKELISLYND